MSITDVQMSKKCLQSVQMSLGVLKVSSCPESVLENGGIFWVAETKETVYAILE